MTNDSWIVAVTWVDGTRTHHGPWAYAEDAEKWLRLAFRPDERVATWKLAILTPPDAGGPDV